MILHMSTLQAWKEILNKRYYWHTYRRVSWMDEDRRAEAFEELVLLGIKDYRESHITEDKSCQMKPIDKK